MAFQLHSVALFDGCMLCPCLSIAWVAWSKTDLDNTHKIYTKSCSSAQVGIADDGGMSSHGTVLGRSSCCWLYLARTMVFDCLIPHTFKGIVRPKVLQILRFFTSLRLVTQNQILLHVYVQILHVTNRTKGQ